MRKYRSKDERYRASRDYLTQLFRMETRFRSLRERRARYQEMATSITPRYDAQPSGGGSAGSKPERYAIKVLELDEELRAWDADYAATVREIERAISALPDGRWRDVLTYRYLNFWAWARIAREMHYSRDYVMRLHADAMVHFKPPAPPKF